MLKLSNQKMNIYKNCLSEVIFDLQVSHCIISKTMSHTASVLSKMTSEDILRLNYKQALMLSGGVRCLSQQKANEFSAKISLLNEHVKHLQLNKEADNQRRVDQITKKYCQNIPYRRSNILVHTETRQTQTELSIIDNKYSQIQHPKKNIFPKQEQSIVNIQKTGAEGRVEVKIFNSTNLGKQSFFQRFTLMVASFCRSLILKNTKKQKEEQIVVENGLPALEQSQQEKKPLKFEQSNHLAEDRSVTSQDRRVIYNGMGEKCNR